MLECQVLLKSCSHDYKKVKRLEARGRRREAEGKKELLDRDPTDMVNK